MQIELYNCLLGVSMSEPCTTGALLRFVYVCLLVYLQRILHHSSTACKPIFVTRPLASRVNFSGQGELGGCHLHGDSMWHLPKEALTWSFSLGEVHIGL